MDTQEKKKEYRYLNLDIQDVKYEHYMEMKKSPFWDIYYQAFEKTKNIILRNDDIEESEKRGKASKKYRELYNIIPFIGKRGTGKTSAMLSYVEALKDYYLAVACHDSAYPYNFFENDIHNRDENVLFTCLDCIDMSLLEKDEDIFKIILAQMYAKLMDLDREGLRKTSDYEYKKREILTKFNILYKNLDKIGASGSRDKNLSSLESLRNFSSSIDVKKTFESFIDEYLDFIDYDENKYYRKGTRHYLVIALDDIDLNIENGFNMLEIIHRYMMVPRVIVFMSLDLNNFQRLCEKHFYNSLPKVNEIIMRSTAQVKELATGYIRKILLISNRIYMPDIDKMDEIAMQTDKGDFPLKKVLFMMMYDKIGIRWDSQGLKRHFYDPATLRGKVGIYLLLKAMETLSNYSESDMAAIYRRNYKILLPDIVQRMSSERLLYEDKAFFDKLSDMRVERIGIEFYRYCFEKGRTQEKQKESLSTVSLMKNRNRYGYSYGELLYMIYCWGRLDSSNKAMVQCFIALFTLEISKLYWLYRYEPEEEDREERKKQILEVVKGSVAGSWSNIFMPKVFRSIRTGEADKNVRSVAHFYGKSAGKIFDISFDTELGHWSDLSDVQLRNMIRTVELICFCFTMRDKTKPVRWVFGIEKINSHPGNPDKELSTDLFEANPEQDKIVIFYKGVADLEFNIMNFVVNALQYKDVFTNIKEAVKGAFLVYYGIKSDEEEFFLAAMDKIYDQVSLKNDFDEWLRYCDGFALPIYNFDLTYNVLKRVAKMHNYVMSVPVSDYLDELASVFENISEQLGSNDEYYAKCEIMSYKSAFDTCPFVREVCNYQNTENNEFRQAFSQVIGYAAAFSLEDVVGEETETYDDTPMWSV